MSPEAGRHARPAPERVREGGRFGEAQTGGDLRQRHVGVSQELFRRLEPDLRGDRPETRAFGPQAAAESAPMDREVARDGFAGPRVLDEFRAQQPPQLLRHLERGFRPVMSDEMFRRLVGGPVGARDRLLQKARWECDGGPFLIESDGCAKELPVGICRVRRRSGEQEFRRRPVRVAKPAHDIDDGGERPFRLEADGRGASLVGEVVEERQVGVDAESDRRAARPGPGLRLQYMKGIADRFRVSDQSVARSEFVEPDALPDEQTEMTASRAARTELEQPAQRGIGNRPAIASDGPRITPGLAKEARGIHAEIGPVSYTHLTLPTKA